MFKVKALIDFGGSVINRDELGFVRKGTELEVSGNDAGYLVREGYAERVEEQPAAAASESTPAAPSDPSPPSS